MTATLLRVQLGKRDNLTVARFRRTPAFDRLRGLAVLLMLVDHALAVTGVLFSVRLTVTRLAMPLFCMVAGALLKPTTTWRAQLKLIAAGVLAAQLMFMAGLAGPGWLLGLALVIAVARAGLHSGPAVMLGLGALALTAAANGLSLGGWVTGYDLLPALGLVVLGWVAHYAQLDVGQRLPAWLEALGRRPLALYLGHLAVLAALVQGGLL